MDKISRREKQASMGIADKKETLVSLNIDLLESNALENTEPFTEHIYENIEENQLKQYDDMKVLLYFHVIDCRNSLLRT